MGLGLRLLRPKECDVGRLVPAASVKALVK